MRTTAHGTEDNQHKTLVLRKAKRIVDEAARRATWIAAAEEEHLTRSTRMPPAERE